MDTRDRCHHCGRLIKYAKNQRRRKYCNDACKQKAYRRHKKFGPDAIPIGQYRAGWEEHGYNELLIEALVALLEDHPSKTFPSDLEHVLALHEAWIKRYSGET